MENLSPTANTEVQKLKNKVLELEKMASLGLLNAGIMHEIQNPMNFILNFSSMSVELLEELQEWQDGVKEKLSEDEVDDLDSLVSLVAQNLKKIEEHGKRADTIVKGMLAYSRNKKQEKSAVQLNEMIARYTDFSYHAMRVNVPGFNVSITKNFDEEVGDVLAYPGELSRAVLNITNNAFYAVWEHAQAATDEYKPQVIISTRLQGEKVEISIEDNGPGIPEEVKASMFEPFFTTKPESKGTGLGLYITKEIVEKAHQGSLSVESKPGSYTRFNISIPLK